LRLAISLPYVQCSDPLDLSSRGLLETMQAKLWQMRYDKQKYKNDATELQKKTVEKAPKDSFLQVVSAFQASLLERITERADIRKFLAG
jgi:hypothetical protein